MEEKRMDYYSQLDIIDGLGDLRSVINNEEVMLNLLCSCYDRHIMGALFDKINSALEKGELVPEDLVLFRTGWLAEQIVNLKSNVQKKGRNLFRFEIGDKLNYISEIKDVPTLTASYTNPMLIEAAGQYGLNNEINYWIGSGTFYNLPMETSLSVCDALIKAGYVEKSSDLLKICINRAAMDREYLEKSVGRTK